MWHVSILSVPLSKDFLLRLKPVIKRTLAGASFIFLVGAQGDLFVQIRRQGRGVRTRLRSAGGSLARCLRFGRCLQFDRPLRFHEFLPMSLTTNQSGEDKARPSVGRCQGSGQGGCFISVPADGFIYWDGKRHRGDCNSELEVTVPETSGEAARLARRPKA